MTPDLTSAILSLGIITGIHFSLGFWFFHAKSSLSISDNLSSLLIKKTLGLAMYSLVVSYVLILIGFFLPANLIAGVLS